MRRVVYRPYLILILFLFSLMSLPAPVSEKIRSVVVCSVAPCWRGLSFIKDATIDFIKVPLPARGQNSGISLVEADKTSQENLILRSQIDTMREWLLFEDRLKEQLERLKALQKNEREDSVNADFFKRRAEELCAALELQIQAVPAKVIFREPASWSSSVWISVGEKDNGTLGQIVIAKNSPVLLGSSLIGVVEYVGKTQSRVRLITDAHLNPSVRAIRGKEQNQYVLEHIEALMFALQVRDDVFSAEEIQGTTHVLSHLKRILGQQVEDKYLAKGALYGSSSPLFRSRSQFLKGVGFNYDFPDEEGPARDLRAGEVYDPLKKREAIGILKAGDLLVTTGLDGVFPAGLRVAIVSKVKSLKEGASSYDIEAVSTAGNLNEINHVFILSPLVK